MTNTHSAVPPTRPMKPGGPGSASTRKWMFRIAWNSVGQTWPGSRSATIQGGSGKHHRLHRHWSIGGGQLAHLACLDPQPGNAPAGDHRAAARLEPRHRGIDQALRQTLARDRRDAGAAAAEQRLAHHRGQQPHQRNVGRRVQRRDGERLDQPLVERVVAQRGGDGGIVGDRGAGAAGPGGRWHACRGRAACATAPTRESAPDSVAASSAGQLARSMNGNIGSAGIASVDRAPIVSR